MIHATSSAPVSANASKKMCHPERCARRESKDLRLHLLLQLSSPNQPQKHGCPSQPQKHGCPIHVAVSPRHGWECITSPSQLLPLLLQLPMLLGTPRLQPWVSTQCNEKGALAPGVCSAVPCRKSSPPRQRLVQASSLLFLIFLLAPSLHAQLPAGTTDATAQPQTAPQDPQRAEANAALDKQDYPTALKLLTTLAAKNPTDAHLLYDLASTQDALDQASPAEATYRQAIAADPAFFDPHLALGLLLARNGKLADARTELDQTTRPADASSELLSALKISPETPDDILLTGELAEASNDLPAAEAAYRRILTADPQNSAATAALTHILLRQNKPDQAEAILTAAPATTPPSTPSSPASTTRKTRPPRPSPSWKSSTRPTLRTPTSPASSPASTAETASSIKPTPSTPPSSPPPRRT